MRHQRRNDDRAFRICVALALAVASLALWASLSGCGASAKQKTLRAAMITLDATKKGIDVYSFERQTQIVADGTDKDLTRKRLETFRARRAGLYELLILCYKAVGTAALDPSDINVMNAMGLVKSFLEAVEKFKTLKLDSMVKPPDDDPDEDVEEYYEFVWARSAIP